MTTVRNALVRNRTRGLLLVALVIAISSFAATAQAASVSVVGGQMKYTAGAGETNDIDVIKVGSKHVLADTGATLSAGSGCTLSGYVVECSGVTSLYIDAGDADDIVEVDVYVTVPSAIYGSYDDDLIISGGGADVINGGDGYDTASYEARSAAVTVDADGVADDGGSGEGDNVKTNIEVISGGSGNDTITATAVNAFVELRGNDGNDTLVGKTNTSPCWEVFYGGEGNDTVNPGGGVDYVFGENGDDVLNGSAGNDTQDGGAGSDTVSGGDGADTLTGGSGADGISGNGGNDVIHARDDENDSINCGANTDTLNADTLPDDSTVSLCETVNRA